MKRRKFITLLGGAAATMALPRAAGAQQRAMPMIGFLAAVPSDGFTDRLRAFREGLKQTGFGEGENLAIEYRWVENQLDRLPAFAVDLVGRRVAVIVCIGSNNLPAVVQAATMTIPIVFGVSEDPVKLGLVASLARPGGNATGINFFIAELVAKRLELLRELMPKAVRLALLVNPANPANANPTVREAARAMSLQVEIFNASTIREIQAAFEHIARERPDALFVGNDAFFLTRRIQLATLAARHALPTSFSTRDYAEAGGLMSYGTNVNDAPRQMGVYTGRILKGEKPADLPVVQSTRFDLVINLATAMALGIEVPPTLLARADEVIE
jgi:ABC-type uncharacterized transport system substrate-binding protein